MNQRVEISEQRLQTTLCVPIYNRYCRVLFSVAIPMHTRLSISSSLTRWHCVMF